MSGRTHVLLDLDGTLSDSEPGIRRSLQWACEQEGFDIPTDTEIRRIIGPPFEIGLPMIGIPDDALERVIETYRQRYSAIGAYENTVYAGIEDLLDRLLAMGYLLAVATAKPEATAHPILDHFGLSERFTVRAGASLDGSRRTKAEVIDHALRELGISADPNLGDRVIMVGDRDHDVHGARAHGIPCIGVTWGYGSPDELLSAGAVALADEPADVATLAAANYDVEHWR